MSGNVHFKLIENDRLDYLLSDFEWKVDITSAIAKLFHSDKVAKAITVIFEDKTGNYDFALEVSKEFVKNMGKTFNDHGVLDLKNSVNVTFNDGSEIKIGRMENGLFMMEDN